MDTRYELKVDFRLHSCGPGVCVLLARVYWLLQPTEYGVDTDYAVNHFDVGSVVVPDTRLELTSAQLSFVEQHHSPLAHSDYNGVELYLSLYGIQCA